MEMKINDKVYCDLCGAECIPDGFTPGYGMRDGLHICFKCCAEEDKKQMDADGLTILYLDTVKMEVTNWPGTLRYKTGPIRTGRHNIAGRQYSTRFQDHAGNVWTARVYGDMTQVAHCRRLKDYHNATVKLARSVGLTPSVSEINKAGE